MVTKLEIKRQYAGMPYFFLFLLGALFNACMSYTAYQKKLPPEITFENSDSPKLLLVSRFDANQLDFNQKKKNQVFEEGAMELLQSLKRNLSHDSRFEVIWGDSVIRGNAWITEPPGQMDKATLTALFDAYPASHILALESFNTDFYQDVEVVKNEDGSKSRTAYYDLIVSANIALYDQEGKAIYHKPLERRMPYKSRTVLSGFLAAGPTVGNADVEVNQLANEIGKDFMTRFDPSTILVQRFYYSGKHFSEVTPHIDYKNWEEAIKLLLPMTEKDNKKIAGKAAYNLSFIYDVLNDPEQSGHWYKEAKKRLGGKLGFVPGHEEMYR